MTLLLCALLGQAASTSENEVVRVELRLPVGADEKLLERIAELVTVRRGQRLSRRAVRRTIESLFESRRFADVVARVLPEAGGVAVVFELVPRRLATDVFFEAAGGGVLAQSLKADLLAAGRFTVGSEYWPERGEQAAEVMAELLRRRGFQEARVRHTAIVNDLGLAIGFVVTQGTPTLLRSIGFVGEPGLELDRALSALGLSTGQVLDLDVVQRGLESLRALLRAQRYFRARVDVPVVLEGGRLVIPIQAGPRFDLIFSGNRRFTDASLRAVIAYDGEELLDAQLAGRLARRLERFYRLKGFRDVRVATSEVTSADQTRAALGFSIEEAEPVRVTEVRFEGNRVLSAAELRDVVSRVIEASSPTAVTEAHATGDPLELEGRTAPVFARDFPSPPPLTVLDEDTYLEALKALTALYRERGFLQASVELAGITRVGNLAITTFKVNEGAQALFRLLQTQGVPLGFRSETVELVKTNSPFSVAALEQVRQGVIRELGRRGYLYADVEATYALDTSGRHADCVILVKSGPQVRVRTVLPVGAERTSDELISRQATMREGQPLDSESLFTTQSNLLGMGAFRTVEVEMLAPERPEPLKTVLLKVKERPRLSAEVAVGYFVAEGPRVVADVSAPNLGGKAINLALRGQINWFALSFPALNRFVDVSDLDALTQFGGRGNLSVQNRGLLPFDIGWRVDVLAERVFRPQFRFTRFAGIPSLDWTRSFEIPRIAQRLKATLALQYELEYARVQETSSQATSVPLTFVDQERLRFLFGTFALQTVRFQPTLDLRDNALTPRRGLLVQGSAEVTGALYAGTPTAPGSLVERTVPVSFFKASALASGYVPLGDHVVLALSLRGGRIVPLVSDAVTPPVKRFFMGGATSMRGFNEDQLIAEDRREQYREEIASCQRLASKAGCSSAANTVAAGRQIPSEGGEFFGLGKTELRFSGLSVLDFGLFFEMGNLWLAMPTTLRLRSILGAGVRYVTPIGPLAFDVGVNLLPDQIINEPFVVAHFNIGTF